MTNRQRLLVVMRMKCDVNFYLINDREIKLVMCKESHKTIKTIMITSICAPGRSWFGLGGLGGRNLIEDCIKTSELFAISCMPSYSSILVTI